MSKVLALVAGVAAWCGVAALSILMVEFYADDNEALTYLPILVAVIAAWAIGEWVTDRVFGVATEGDQ